MINSNNCQIIMTNASKAVIIFICSLNEQKFSIKSTKHNNSFLPNSISNQIRVVSKSFPLCHSVLVLWKALKGRKHEVEMEKILNTQESLIYNSLVYKDLKKINLIIKKSPKNQRRCVI